jgi:hypothetical protein
MPAAAGSLIPVNRAFADIRQLLLNTAGVQSVSSVRFFPLGILPAQTAIHAEGVDGSRMVVNIHPVGPNYLGTMGIPALRGRDVSDEDMRIPQDKVLPVVINSSMANELFGTSDPLGRRIVLERANNESPERIMQIVGVARNSKLHSLNEGAIPILYLPELSTSFVVRVSGAPQAWIRSIERALIDHSPGASVQVSPMSVEVASALLPTKIGSLILAGLSAISLVLAMLGLYTIVSAAVERRKFEIGVRVALGASTGDVLWAVFKEAALLIGIGSLAGGVLSLPLLRVLSPLTMPDHPFMDTSALIIAAGLLISISGVATLSPARRAAQVDPAVILRHN